MNHFGLVQPDNRFGQGVIIAIAFATDRRGDACLSEPLGVADREVLRTADALLFVKLLEAAGLSLRFVV